MVSDVKVADLGRVTSRFERRDRLRTSARLRSHLSVNLVVTGGAGAIEPAVTWLGRAEGVSLRAVEFALRDEDDLSHNARRLIHVVDSLEEQLDDVTVYAEPPMLRGEPTHGWLSALDELAAREISLKFRTGGLTEDLFPGSPDLASCLEAALDRELPFKCTAGLHHAVRNRDAETGFAHHGFLNVLLATRASLDGNSLEEVAGVLDDTDGPALADRLREDPDPGRAHPTMVHLLRLVQRAGGARGPRRARPGLVSAEERPSRAGSREQRARRTTRTTCRTASSRPAPSDRASAPASATGCST